MNIEEAIIARGRALKSLRKPALVALLPPGWGHLIPAREMVWAICAAEFGSTLMPEFYTFCDLCGIKHD